MSFMFHPFPYVDHDAVNVITGRGVVPVKGAIAVAKKIAAMLKEGKNVGVDAYPGTDIHTLINVLHQVSAGAKFTYVDAATLLKPADELTEMLKPYLPEDRDIDPVLLYGRRYKDGYAGLQVAEKVEALKQELTTAKGMVVYGQGALAPELQDSYDVRVWMDITPRTAALNFKYGHVRNIGAGEDLPYGLLMRRNYYVDFETAIDVRWNMIKNEKIDLYISADVPEDMQMVTFAELKTLFEELNESPFRCRPVYLEGVWGGFYIYRLRNLPK